MASRQKFRLTLLFLSLLLFPVTLNYLSVYLIIESASKGIANFSLFFWGFWTVSALIGGRVLCGYLCPLGAVQEVRDRMGGGRLKRVKYLKAVKYALAAAWVGVIAWAAASAGGYKRIDLLYNTPRGISVDSIQSLIMYYMVLFIPLLPALLMGRRSFCHYFCPWGVLNIVSTRIKDFFSWPSLHLVPDTNKCKQCHTCSAGCPMSLPVVEMVQAGSMKNDECILCGTCVDNCPNDVVRYSWGKP